MNLRKLPPTPELKHLTLYYVYHSEKIQSLIDSIDQNLQILTGSEDIHVRLQISNRSSNEL